MKTNTIIIIAALVLLAMLFFGKRKKADKPNEAPSPIADPITEDLLQPITGADNWTAKDPGDIPMKKWTVLQPK